MGAMQRKRARLPPFSHERWLVSYADFITLLFAFFTTMYAISTVDAEKLQNAASSMQTAFSSSAAPPVAGGAGVLPGGGGQSVVESASGAGRVLKDLADVRIDLESRLSREVGAGLVDLVSDPRGLVVSMREGGSFATGSAALSTSAESVLLNVADSVRGIDNLVRVEGHTDDVPIRTTQYASNWDLSAARATNVVRFLAERAGVPPARLSAAGYGEFRPRGPNDSAERRAQNRRVDLVILNPATSRAEEPRLR
jgi:chemotaxis protein MotB